MAHACRIKSWKISSDSKLILLEVDSSLGVVLHNVERPAGEPSDSVSTHWSKDRRSCHKGSCGSARMEGRSLGICMFNPTTLSDLDG